MFYEPRRSTAGGGHGLPHPLAHDPIKAIVAPRPIGWISTVDAAGTPNLAPYSYFNMVGNDPPLLAFGSEGLKHSAANARATGEFVFNLATRALFDAMNASSGDHGDGVSEFAAAGIAAATCRIVRAPRVAASPAALECRVVTSLDLPDSAGRPTRNVLTVGEVVGIHLDEAFLRGGRFDAVAAGTIARLGYRDYAEVTDVFSAPRPTD